MTFQRQTEALIDELTVRAAQGDDLARRARETIRILSRTLDTVNQSSSKPIEAPKSIFGRVPYP